MSTIFEQPSSSSNFNMKNRATGGIKRIKKSDGPTNFYQQIEYNAERLQLNFPQKDKVQLMKLLEELDNQIEVAHEILTSEMNTSQSQSSVNSAFKTQQYPNNYEDYEMSLQNNYNSNNMMDQMQMMNQDNSKFSMAEKEVLKERRIVKNLKLKQGNNEMLGKNQTRQGQKSSNSSQLQGVGLSSIQQSPSARGDNMNFNSIQEEDSFVNDRQNTQLKSQMSYGMPTSSNQLESKISQEASSTQIEDQIYQRQASSQNQKQQQQSLHQDNNDDDDQQSATQEEDSQSQQSQVSSEQPMQRTQVTTQQQMQYRQQQQIQSNRLRDFNQIEQYQKSVVDTIIPQLLQQLKNTNIEQAPDLLLQAFKYYEEQNRRAIQYDKIINVHEQILKGLQNIIKIKKSQEYKLDLLTKENEKLSNERDQYRNKYEQYFHMLKNNQPQQQSQPFDYYNNHFDKGGNSGMCY